MSIVIEDAVKKYGRGESEIYALNHVSLQIESGEVCVILGPSGSGKSTLLHMIGGLDQLDSVSAGEVLEILEKINEKYHTTILIITHNENMAGMADRIIRVHDGKIVSNEKNKKVPLLSDWQERNFLLSVLFFFES